MSSVTTTETTTTVSGAVTNETKSAASATTPKYDDNIPDQAVWFQDEGDPNPFETMTVAYVPRTFENEGPEPEPERQYTAEEQEELEKVKAWLRAKHQSWGEEYDGWNDKPQETNNEEDPHQFDKDDDDEDMKKKPRIGEDGKVQEEEEEEEVQEQLIGWHDCIEQKARDWRLEGNEDWTLTDEDIPIVCNGVKLQVNKLLRKLDFDNNDITDLGFQCIAEMLQSEYATFERLYLSKNKISDTGATYIVEALYKNSTLKLLHMQDNNLGDKTAEAFQQYLRSNGHLECLDLSKNMRITTAGFRGFIDALKANSRLVILELSFMKMDKDVKKELKYLVGKDVRDRDLKQEDFFDPDNKQRGEDNWKAIDKMKLPVLCWLRIREEEDLKRYRH